MSKRERTLPGLSSLGRAVGEPGLLSARGLLFLQSKVITQTVESMVLSESDIHSSEGDSTNKTQRRAY